jgi:microcin C transport system substrate-binding protein
MGSELASSGIPQGKELEILEQFRSELPPELFTQEFKLPVYNTPQDERTHLREALGLLRDAGWTLKDGRLVDKNGQPFEFEILSNSDSLETAINSYANTLRKIGITVRMRLVDTSQYTNRINDYDFDMILASLAQSESPGNEQREYWSSAAAKTPGTQNYAGISDPVVDALIELIVAAPTREILVARTEALDRVLLWGHYVVPQFRLYKDWVASWDRFSHPKTTPKVGYSSATWWVDPQKDAALRQKRGQ